MYVFFVRVCVVMSSASGRAGLRLEVLVVGGRLGDVEFDVCELAGCRREALSRGSCSDISVDSASEVMLAVVSSFSGVIGQGDSVSSATLANRCVRRLR